MIIAQNNIARYHSTGQIDMEYLKGLSYDAVPYTAELARDEDVGDEVLVYLKDKNRELEYQSDWQSLNLSRMRASRVIDKYIK